MNKVFEKFIEEFQNNEICYVKKEPNVYKIIVVAMAEKFDTWNHLKRLNDILLSNGDTFGYKKFILE